MSTSQLQSGYGGGGGGGLTGFTSATSTTGVNASVNTSVLTVDVASANGDLVLKAKGYGAILASNPDGTSVGGNKRNSYSVDLQSWRTDADRVASGAYAVITGGGSNKAAGQWSFVGSGQNNQANNNYSAVLTGQANTVNNLYATVLCGISNQVTGQYSIIANGNSNTMAGGMSFIGSGQTLINNGGYSAIVSGTTNTISTGTNNFIGSGETINISSGSYNTISGGRQNTVSATYGTIAGGINNAVYNTAGFVGGGWGNVATNAYSSVLGGWYNDALADYSSAIGMLARPNAWNGFAHGGSRFVSAGEVQYERVIFSRQTTTGAASEMFLDGAEAVYNGVAPTRRFVLDTNCAYAFSILAVGRRRDVVGEAAAYKIEGAIRSNAGTVSFIGTPTKTVLGEDVAAWDVAVSANNTNKTLELIATGEAAKTIRWSAVVELIKIV
jgi:hypothetical protein